MARTYVWLGKTPNKEIMKLITRKGTMLSCGCEPPVDPRADGAMITLGATSEYILLSSAAHTSFWGLALVPAPELQSGTWLCAGICEVVRVTDSTPAVCP